MRWVDTLIMHEPITLLTDTNGPLVEPRILRVLGEPRQVELSRGQSLHVGAARENELVLSDRWVSRFHCRIERKANGWFVEDVRSRNGTFLNGHLVGLAQLVAGDKLRVGTTTLMAMADGSAEASARELLVGTHPLFLRAVDGARVAAPTDLSVLIRGETGVGKELFARLVHEESKRSRGPFVAVNCGALPRTLVESELFGHEKGAFTGAVDRRAGLFEQAAGGTLFLDEIGEMPLELQAHLLRVLETRRVRAVGGTGEREVDVRVVAATHRDLPGDGFRDDLYYRLAEMEVQVPALRERASDVPKLVRCFLRGGKVDSVDDEVASRLAEQPWPGNVRELKLAARRAGAFGKAPLGLSDFLRSRASPRRATRPVTEPVTMQEIERSAIADAMARSGSIRKAASMLGMPRSTLFEKARRLGLLESVGHKADGIR